MHVCVCVSVWIDQERKVRVTLLSRSTQYRRILNEHVVCAAKLFSTLICVTCHMNIFLMTKLWTIADCEMIYKIIIVLSAEDSIIRMWYLATL